MVVSQEPVQSPELKLNARASGATPNARQTAAGAISSPRRPKCIFLMTPPAPLRPLEARVPTVSGPAAPRQRRKLRDCVDLHPLLALARRVLVCSATQILRTAGYASVTRGGKQQPNQRPMMCCGGGSAATGGSGANGHS